MVSINRNSFGKVENEALYQKFRNTPLSKDEKFPLARQHVVAVRDNATSILRIRDG